jgi:hypothetical protein
MRIDRGRLGQRLFLTLGLAGKGWAGSTGLAEASGSGCSSSSASVSGSSRRHVRRDRQSSSG